MKLPSDTWVPGVGPRPDDAWLADIEPELLIDIGAHLFERGQGFEAHEAWEQAWKSAKQTDDHDLERVLRALIRLAAAMVKVRQGNAQGIRDHAHGAHALLVGLLDAGTAVVAGFDVAGLVDLAARVAAQPPVAAPVPHPLFGLIPRGPLDGPGAARGP